MLRTSSMNTWIRQAFVGYDRTVSASQAILADTRIRADSINTQARGYAGIRATVVNVSVTIGARESRVTVTGVVIQQIVTATTHTRIRATLVEICTTNV